MCGFPVCSMNICSQGVKESVLYFLLCALLLPIESLLTNDVLVFQEPCENMQLINITNQNIG